MRVVKVSLDQELPWPTLCCRQGPPIGWTRRAGRWGQWKEEGQVGLIFLWDIPSSRHMCRPKPRARYGTRSWPSVFRYCFFIMLSLSHPSTNRRGVCKGHVREVRGGRGQGVLLCREHEEAQDILQWTLLELNGGNSLVVQWLGLYAFTADGLGLIPHQGTTILQVQAVLWGQKKKRETNMTQMISTNDQVQFSSIQLLSCVQLFATSWTTARQASLSITNSWSPPKPMSIESVMPSNHLILCRPLLLPPSIFPSIGVFSNESALCIRWPK